MDIQQWQNHFSIYANKKFPNNSKWTQQDRILSILRQLSDVSGTIQNEQNLLAENNHEHRDTNHRIAALLADIFILCEQRNINLNDELKKVLDWYKSGSL